VAEGTAAGCHNDVGVAQLFEERWQSQGVYFARNDGRSLRHALPFLVVIRSIRLVLLQHERDVLVRSIIFILPKLMVPTWMLLAAMTREILVWTKAV
jgi:hypothetical protein